MLILLGLSRKTPKKSCQSPTESHMRDCITLTHSRLSAERINNRSISVDIKNASSSKVKSFGRLVTPSTGKVAIKDALHESLAVRRVFWHFFEKEH